MERRELFSDRHIVTLSVDHWQEITEMYIQNQETPNVKTRLHRIRAYVRGLVTLDNMVV